VIADITAGPITMTVIRAQSKAAVAPTRAPSKAVAATPVSPTMRTPPSQNFAVAHLRKSITSPRAGGT
jgi:hypothetical protein